MRRFFDHSERLRCQKISGAKGGCGWCGYQTWQAQEPAVGPDKAAAKAENALNEKVVPVGFTTHVAASLHQSINERVYRTSKRTTWG
jgi:hypothetical protein